MASFLQNILGQGAQNPNTQAASQATTTTNTTNDTTFGGNPVTNTTTNTFTPYTRDNFDYEKYFQENKDKGTFLDDDDGTRGPRAKERIWNDYVSKGATWGGGGINNSNTTSSATGGSLENSTKIVPGKATGSEINVTDAGSDIIKNPDSIVSGSNSLQDQNDSHMTGNEAGTTVNPNDPKYQMDPDKLKQTADTVDQVAGAEQVDPREAQTYDVEKTEGKVADNQLNAEQGQLSEEAKVNADDLEIDVGAIANGTDPDGVGEALKDFASLDPNDVDPKATVKGQLQELQSEFKDADGNPKIPMWAQSTARSVGRVIAFSGMSGSAATAAMANAIMESSIPVAQQDAQFFQTLTLQNLSNEQASTINRANVLANMTLANQDARTAAAIQNSQAFLQMDMKNLDNRQQAAVINNQNRINSILEDAKQVNTQRMFTAQSQNEMDMYYDNLNASIQQFNASQVNGMAQFNTSQTNGMKQFNAELENNREQFYQNMQYQIDTANAKWRQTVTLQEDQQAFEAAATDVKNSVGITTEQLNQLWDRSDSLLQYAWQTSENEADRKANMAIAQYQAKMATKGGKAAGYGAIAGSIAGAVGSKIVDGLF